MGVRARKSTETIREALTIAPTAYTPTESCLKMRKRGLLGRAADVGGPAALLKKPLKHSKSVIFSSRRKRLTGEQKSAGVIRNGQRVAVVLVAEQELAFVIRAPELVGLLPQR